MKTHINGLQDIKTILMNERKLGGAVEAEMLRLRTGEVFHFPAITGVDMNGSAILSVSFFTSEGKRFIVGVNEIGLISEPAHKRLYELNNKAYKAFKISEKLKYLSRLCELNEGSCTPCFKDEATRIAEDIGQEALGLLKSKLPFLQPERKLVSVRTA